MNAARKLTVLAVVAPALFTLSSLVFASSPTRGDAVMLWTEALGGLADRLPPHLEARAYAMTCLAIEDALLAGRGVKQPIGADDRSAQTAASEAAHQVLRRLVPGKVGRIDEVAANILQRLATVPSTNALAIGRAVAMEVLNRREADGWDVDALYGVPILRDVLSPTGSGGDAWRSPWLAATPFVLKSAGMFEASVRLPYWRDMDGEILPDYLIVNARVFAKVDRKTPAATLAQFWSGSAVSTWNRIARAVADQCGLDPVSRAHAFALINVAIADATLAALHAQGVIAHRRFSWHMAPAEAIGADPLRSFLTDTYPGATSMEYGVAVVRVQEAQLQNYPAVAATVASAACSVLRDIPNVEGISLELGPAGGEETGGGARRRFASITAAAQECGYAASLDGVHSREACVAGWHLGDAVGDYVLKRSAKATVVVSSE